jgi:predicted helicase
MPPNNLRDIHAFPDLVRYLEDELDWPLQEYGFDELTFEYIPAELGLKEEDAAHIKAIHQLRPLASGQPWGIFFVEFENKKLPVVVLRRILSHLVIKKRASANKASAPAWHAEDLLFVTAYGEENTDTREIAFAHFHQTPGDLPTLHVLGWDGGDTPLKLANVDRVLHERLHWPEDESDADAWRETWSKPFKHKLGHVIRTADMLAEELARLARGIRDKAKRMLAAESDKGPLTKLYKAFQTALIHDLTPESFADTYAQTITYGLLTAAISRTEMSEGRHGTALLADDIANIVPVTNPFLKEMLQTFLKVGGRKGGIDFDELGIQDVVELLRGEETDLPEVIRDFGNRKPGEDPVIHFYEHFLSAYNRQLKIQRGVFYTPQPVVSYIVRSVHELLQTEFGLEGGLASTITWGEMAARHPSPARGRGVGGEGGVQSGIKIPEGTDPDSHFVTILDPATGTATFLVEAITVIHRTLMEIWAKQGLSEAQRLDAWNEYVPRHLLPRLYGYELMMAPYAIAHMKIGLKLFETGYRFDSKERVRVYLTNTLEPAHEVQPQLEALAPALAHEAQAVAEVKRDVRFTVVVGNPPYSSSISEPEWLMRLLDDWKQGLNETKSDLNREEWKFLRVAEYQSVTTGTGIVGFIINRDFLDGIVKRKMREHLGQSFPLRIVVDLNGDVKGNISDENVFDIEQGVTIVVLSTEATKPALRFTSRVGTRAQKYADLSAKKPIDATLTEQEPAAPYFRWIPFASATAAGTGNEYAQWIPLDTVFTLKSSGIQTKNDPICIGWSANEVFERVERLANLNEKEAREVFGLHAGGVWSLTNAQADLRQFGVSHKDVRRILYRPLDFRFTYYTHKSSGFLGRPRYDLMRHMLDGNNLGLIFNRQIVGDSVSHFSVSRDLTCHGTFYLGNKGQDYLAPLYLRDDDLLSRHGDTWTPNFTAAFAAALRGQLASAATKLTPEDIFHYVYAVFHSPGYRSRYAEFLKIDFPRLPLTGNLELFRALARLGGELVALHLLESPKVDVFITRFRGEGDNSIPKKPTYRDGAVWINATQRFDGVPEAVWNFHIGGYQVCEKWLKDRKGRTLSADDIAHYQRVVVALNETIRLMAEIDRVIEAHGGWPGAFKTTGESDAAA